MRATYVPDTDDLSSPTRTNEEYDDEKDWVDISDDESEDDETGDANKEDVGRVDGTPEEGESDDEDGGPPTEFIRIYKEEKSQSTYNTRPVFRAAIDENDPFSTMFILTDILESS